MRKAKDKSRKFKWIRILKCNFNLGVYHTLDSIEEILSSILKKFIKI